MYKLNRLVIHPQIMRKHSKCILVLLIVIFLCLHCFILASAIEVPAGEYIVGEDIPEGTYTVANNGGILNFVDVFTNTEDANNKKYGEIHIILNDYESIGKLSLEKGNVVKLQKAVTFEPYKGLGFDMNSKAADEEKLEDKEGTNSDQEVPSSILERVESLEERVGYLESVFFQTDNHIELIPTPKPNATPTVKPTATPLAEPTATPTAARTLKPKNRPTATPAASPKSNSSGYNYTTEEFSRLIQKGINGTLTREEAELLQRYYNYFK